MVRCSSCALFVLIESVISRAVDAATFLHLGSGHGGLKQDEASHIANATAVDMLAGLRKQAVMPIEDQLMGLTEEAKTAMYGEMTLHGSPVRQAIAFVRSHPNDGWSWCANDGQTSIATAWYDLDLMLAAGPHSQILSLLPVQLFATQ
jgi:hypothetical protein